jgi:hypothetical protein
MSDSGQKSPAERVLDLAVYAPLGFALTVAESFPQLVRKGRSSLGPQIGLARTVGQFAVRQGFRQLRGFAAQRPPFPFWSPFGQEGSGTPGREGTARSAPRPSPSAENGNGRSRARPSAPTTARPAPGPSTTSGAAGDGSLAAAHLAIPSYDSLSASQVVQRLAGLSRDEVEAVRAYEAATRGRRTILTRAEQLLA